MWLAVPTPASLTRPWALRVPQLGFELHARKLLHTGSLASAREGRLPLGDPHGPNRRPLDTSALAKPTRPEALSARKGRDWRKSRSLSGKACGRGGLRVAKGGKGGACWRGRVGKNIPAGRSLLGQSLGARRGLVLGAEPGGQGFTCGSHPLVPANRAV